MKPLDTVITENPGYNTLIKAVYDQAGENLNDIIKFGIDPGFNGFVYYKDTCKFYRDNRDQINDLIKSDSLEEGYNEPSNMLKKLEWLEGIEEPLISNLIEECLTGTPTNESLIVQNALTWYTVERVSKWFID